ncbi:uncharacterized protein RAG0_02898 [Rhynchosporium agropyri]|uniref:Uncharacterized protein n=1 Tax=Rhynchosporium agropyri TaxID=914238 RepID=A0A1E1K350_9HELO|nr:uncharacterized protein RAG0_02898 [Rhynchosporium agropyri]
MARFKFSPFIFISMFSLLTAAQDDLRPLCSIASAQFVVGGTSLFTFEPGGKCTEAQLVFNDSSSIKIDINGPDCTGFATHHVSLNATTPPGWAEFFLRCDDGGLCKSIYVQPKSSEGTDTPNKIFQECLGVADPIGITSSQTSFPTEAPSSGVTQLVEGTMGSQSRRITQSFIDSFDTSTATVLSTYPIVGQSTGTPEPSSNTYAAPVSNTDPIAANPIAASQSDGIVHSFIDNFDTYTVSVPSTYPVGSQTTSISSADITSTTNNCGCCTST